MIERLSEAIRLGSVIRPQTFGAIYSWVGPGYKAKTCALGAALEACGCLKRSRRIAGKNEKDTRGNVLPEGTMITSYRRWPDNLWRILCLPAKDPCPCGFTGRLIEVIPHLNDTHHWTRQEIADFVERVEIQRLGKKQIQHEEILCK